MTATVATHAPPRPALSRSARRWVAESLLLRVPGDAVVSALARRGYPASAVESEIEALASDPVFEAATRMALRHLRLSTLSRALAHQSVQPGSPRTVPVRDRLVPEEFYDDFYFANRPVVIQGLIDTWPALSAWTPGYFAERFGDEPIEITGDRDADPRYEDHFVEHRRTVPMAEFVRLIEGRQTNDVYVVGKNHLLDRPAFAPLWDDFSFPNGYLDASRAKGAVRLWFGPLGTVTPLHHDDSAGLLAQVRGRKLVRLVAPWFTELVYNDRECYSAVDLTSIDYDRFPNMRHVRVLEVTIGPGDVLFIPLGWWHWVQSLSLGISLSMRNWAIEGPTPVWKF